MSKLISKIKKEFENNNYNSILTYISQIKDKKTFIELREQKIINKLMDRTKSEDIYTEYSKCVFKILEDNFDGNNYFSELCGDIDTIEYDEEVAYLDFVLITSLIKERADKNIRKEIDKIKDYDKISCIKSILCWMKYEQERIIEITELNYYKRKRTNDQLPYDKILYAEYVHDLNAKIVNFLYVGARLITNIVNSIDEKGENGCNLLISKQIERMFGEHSLYEANENFIDKVAYGEYKVKFVDFDRGECKLKYNNSELIKVRYQQIRDKVLTKQSGTGKRSIVKDMFEEAIIGFMIKFVEFYENEFKYKFSREREDIINNFRVRMCEFTDDDDLILLCFNNDKRVVATYLFAAILLSISVINFNLEYMGEPSIRERELFYIPLDLIIDYVCEEFDLNIDDRVIKYFCLEGNIKNSKDLLKKPFIITEDGCVFGLLGYTNWFYWIENIRNNFIKGNKASKEFGTKWERIIENIFNESGWTILGNGIKLKKNGQDITDIDLLVEKEGIILVIQSKGIGACTLPYEIWKARNTIEEGIDQAINSMEFLENNTDFLLQILNVKKVDYTSIKKIQPFVITPNTKFSGWKSKDVPVISVGNLLNILEVLKSKVETNDTAQEVLKMMLEGSNKDFNSQMTHRVIYENINFCGVDFYVPDIKFDSIK